MHHGMHGAQENGTGELIHIVDERNQKHEPELASETWRGAEEDSHRHRNRHKKQKTRCGQQIEQRRKGHIEMHCCVLASVRNRLISRPQRLLMPRRSPAVGSVPL